VTFNYINGANPYGGLISDAAGNLFGTTTDGYGTVFEIPKTSTGYGTPITLASFNGANGLRPMAGLISDAAGDLFGTTEAGGAYGGPPPNGYGTVFEIPKTSTGYGTPLVLVSFNNINGANPYSGLISDAAGDLFGTTVNGGSGNKGTVFEIPKTSTGYGTLITLVSFNVSFNGANGANPYSGLISDAAGDLFGTTESGAAYYCSHFCKGTVFKLTGTGFVPVIPFSAFSAKLDINLIKKPNQDSLRLQSDFTLGSASNGINPVTEAVTLQIGSFTTTIPAGSFEGKKFGPFEFHGTIDGVNLHVEIRPTGAKRYAFEAEAWHASLTGTTNPVPVTLTIGDDSGTTSIKANIDKDVARRDDD
jgi:uncharacterized repeat protein (TIGR03803 family)